MGHCCHPPSPRCIFLRQCMWYTCTFNARSRVIRPSADCTLFSTSLHVVTIYVHHKDKREVNLDQCMYIHTDTRMWTLYRIFISRISNTCVKCTCRGNTSHDNWGGGGVEGVNRVPPPPHAAPTPLMYVPLGYHRCQPIG